MVCTTPAFAGLSIRTSVVAAAAALACLAGTARGQDYHFTIVAQSGDPLPQGGGTFTTFTVPIFDGETVGFASDDRRAMYKSVGGGAPLLVAHDGDEAPGLAAVFAPNSINAVNDAVWALSPARGGVPYYAFVNNAPIFGGVEGIFSDIDQPNMLASEAMSGPEGGFLLFAGGPYASDNRNVLLRASTTIRPLVGCYLVFSGEVRRVVETDQVIARLAVPVMSVLDCGDIRNEWAVVPIQVLVEGVPQQALLRYRTSNGGLECLVTNLEVRARLAGSRSTSRSLRRSTRPDGSSSAHRGSTRTRSSRRRACSGSMTTGSWRRWRRSARLSPAAGGDVLL